MNNYTIAAFKHGATLIKGLQSFGFNAQMEQLISSGSGAVDPTFASIGQLKPEITFETTAIKTALANIGGISGAALSSDVFFFQKMAEGGLRAGALAHIKGTMATGIIVPTQVKAGQGKEATLGYKVTPTSADGDASPIALTASQSLEAAQDQVSEIYTLGPVSINGAALEGVDDVTLDFGIELWTPTHDGNVYLVAVGIMKRAPKITIKTFDLDKFQSWGIEGAVQGASDSTIQLLDQTEGGARGSSPITFTVDAGMVHFESTDGSHGQQASGSAIITPTSDGVADIIALSGI